MIDVEHHPSCCKGSRIFRNLFNFFLSLFFSFCVQQNKTRSAHTHSTKKKNKYGHLEKYQVLIMDIIFIYIYTFLVYILYILFSIRFVSCCVLNLFGKIYSKKSGQYVYTMRVRMCVKYGNMALSRERQVRDATYLDKTVPPNLLLSILVFSYFFFFFVLLMSPPPAMYSL